MHHHSPSPSFSSSEEIKTKSPRNATVRKRSKRIRRPENSWFSDQQCFHQLHHLKKSDPVSSISNASPEEVVAYCLIMLSQDKWITHEEKNDDKPEPEPMKNSYRCGTCNKLFRSHQALGGHIASHKKVKLSQQTVNVIEDKIYECHVCFKVFNSGQALGGHKRSHVSVKQGLRQSVNLIDLNHPAPSDEVGQIEFNF